MTSMRKTDESITDINVNRPFKTEGHNTDNPGSETREKKPCLIYEYCILRYVADIEREEFVNVGLMMMCKRRRWMKVKLHVDEKRVKSMFMKADLERVHAQLGIFTAADVPSPGLPVEERYRWLAAVKSAIIQTSPSHPGIIRHNPDMTAPEISGLLEERFKALFNRLIL